MKSRQFMDFSRSSASLRIEHRAILLSTVTCIPAISIHTFQSRTRPVAIIYASRTTRNRIQTPSNFDDIKLRRLHQECSGNSYNSRAPASLLAPKRRGHVYGTYHLTLHCLFRELAGTALCSQFKSVSAVHCFHASVKLLLGLRRTRR